jgi:galactose mutarotase-like enzyme
MFQYRGTATGIHEVIGYGYHPYFDRVENERMNETSKMVLSDEFVLVADIRAIDLTDP